MISAKGLTFSYGERPPLFKDLSFNVEDGGLLHVTGSSGKGKTTLLHCLCGIITNYSGEVRIDGESIGEITRERLPRSVSLVFQQPLGRMFLPSVEDELAFTPENLCFPREDIRERIERVLEQTGLINKRFEPPAKLSGGQVKLLALAAVLVVPPRVLVLDELTAGLDDAATTLAVDCINSLRKQGCAVIFSDHRNLWVDEDIQFVRF